MSKKGQTNHWKGEIAMKKILILNGGPRMHNNTAKLLAAAGEGAVSAGASTETIDLYKLNFTDCRSCLACKNKRWPSPGRATGQMA